MKKHFTPPHFLFMLLFSTFVVAQNVGINTDKPTHPLHVKSTTDPLKLEGVQKDNANTSPYYLIIGDNGVVKKTIQKKGVIKFKDPDNGSKSVTWDLSKEDPVEYYVIDGNANYTITLPKGVTGMKIGFYVWGGGNTSKLTFKGSRNGPLDYPGSINYSNTGISWSGSILTIQTNDGKPQFRHTLLEFICLENNQWRFIHPIYR